MSIVKLHETIKRSLYRSNSNINIIINRSNEQRLKNFGQSLSVKSRQYRTKRIDVNVKINTLAYSVEVFGGVVLGCLAFVPSATYLYIAIEIWYGIVIPSCYLVNCSDIKKSIMEKGWVSAICNLYTKKKPKNRPTSAPRRNLEEKKAKDEVQGAHSGTIDEQPNNLKNKKESSQVHSRGKYNQDDSTDETYKQTSRKKSGTVIVHDLDNLSVIYHSVEKTTSKNCQNITKTSENMGFMPKTKDKEVSVFCISNNSNGPFKHATDTNDEPELLPGQVDSG